MLDPNMLGLCLVFWGGLTNTMAEEVRLIVIWSTLRIFSIGDAPIFLDESTDEEQFWRTAVIGVTSDCTKKKSGKS